MNLGFLNVIGVKKDFYIDLLFYHIKLRCYVVIELKSGEFKAEHAGKMNLYLSAIDDSLKSPGDNPSIGLILCREKNKILAEYALRDVNKPIGLSEYRLTKILPKNIKTFERGYECGNSAAMKSNVKF
ncbi:MAG: hypothetical protein A2887_03980 [Alphaproteobacteria bacterium RIFCSPLOWO2_01_FULL_40_26]|nr:MAG: hypothetical protein A3D15_04040 [Alphaproteobacteria bacterium RIFCSPHIGHO2_02_FULL_40_34]OFW94719.1 MAG: hypothetical protein A2887_03980 [Alphaproteobacteria bacterium RIFCSPLOWO2_01_FULL_40_26]OFX10351.1 MAG: hypothetical protein A3H30_05890 [Alphaproteobacteria bacterium RIFCSPLOWO2_02_FULL_40_19]OFX11941.1 MAG: hypothetical protein A3G22_05885 [Alphaproteobacteria bacterium RIFCSPLOWO2_12_FULL_40_11]